MKRIHIILFITAICLCIGFAKFFNQSILTYTAMMEKDANVQKNEGVIGLNGQDEISVVKSANKKRDSRKLRNEEPRAQSYESAVTVYESEATSHELRATSHELRATSHKPRVTSHEPRVTSHEPRATNDEPRVKSHEPRVKSQEPRALEKKATRKNKVAGEIVNRQSNDFEDGMRRFNLKGADDENADEDDEEEIPSRDTDDEEMSSRDTDDEEMSSGDEDDDSQIAQDENNNESADEENSDEEIDEDQVASNEDDAFDGDFDERGEETKEDEDFDTESLPQDENKSEFAEDDDDESYDEQFESDFEKEFARQDADEVYSEEDEDYDDGENIEGDESTDVEKVVSAAESSVIEEIKNAYAKNDLREVHRLHKANPNLTSIEVYRKLYAEIKFYRKSLRGRKVQEQIKNWSQFLEYYPQSVHAKFAKSKLLFAIGRNIYRIPSQKRQQSLQMKDLPQNAKDLVDLAIVVWKSNSAKSYSMLKSVHKDVFLGQVHQGVQGLQYYLYLRDIRRNLQSGQYKMAMELKFEVSGEVELEAYFLLQALENEILTQKELEEYESALKLVKDGDYRKAFTVLSRVKNQGNSFYRDKAAAKLTEVVETIIGDGIKKGEKYSAKQKFSAATATYKSLSPYALTLKQQQLLEDKISQTSEMEFRSYYVAAQKFFKEKQYRKCLSEIIKAEKFYNGTPDIYLQELKNLIVERVFKAHDQEIRKLIDREQLVEAENYINKIYSQHDPGQKHRDNIARYAEFIAIYPKIIKAYENKEYAKSSEFCQRALRYYSENARVNKIYKFTIEESNTITRRINNAREAIHKGYIVRALKEIDYCERIARTEMNSVEELKKTWFLQLATKYNAKFIKDVMYFVKEKDRWILDMTVDRWKNLSLAKKIEVSQAYQEAYAVQENVPVENTFAIPKKNGNDEDVNFEMVFVPPARFLMGSPSDEKDRFTDELRHIVVLDTAYWMGKYEVSVAQWEAVTGRKIHQLKLGDDKAENTPVSHVSWDDIRRHFLSRAHESFRLPTEAEWEYTCRAGTQSRFYWGDDPKLEDIKDYAWYNENTEKVGEPYVHEIATKDANPWGLFDMSGNMYEWCNDWSGPYPKGEAVNPQGAKNGKMRVYRGGLWFHDAKYCRSAARVSYYPDYRGYYIGFRLFRRHADHKIVIAHMDWVASSVVERIMQRMIEKEFNIPVKFLPVSQTEVWGKLEAGVVDIHPDVWLPNHQEMFNKYVEKKKTMYARLSYRNAFQGFYIPEYVADKYEIYHIRDLQGREDLFDLNHDGIGDVWVGEPEWLTSKINEVKVRSYQLNLDALTLYEREIIDIVRERVLSRKPIVFYSWEPNPVVEWSTLRRLEEPKYDVTKWNFHQENIENSKITCGYPEASVYVLASSQLKERHPQVFKFLMNWYFPIEELKDLMLKVESISKTASSLEITDIITKWMDENPRIKRDWLRGVR
ncbi:SUMF1/EgtB/PvdO family nonheme iron enzyme [Candidatus Uabimicrobium amorphum]|uniref:SUMF1/EgtB/PvdO family nonheme iron enzyme n=1 Tax=Uabimicrobium amorphum TaxID=2596890 RepID=UPI0034A4A412